MANYCLCLFLVPLLLVACARSHADELDAAMNGRHFAASREQLESYAGGADALVQRLLKLRTNEEPPFVGLRAEKLLLQYVQLEAVVVALEEDLANPKYKGLAQMIALHLDQVSGPEVRLRLARGVIKRAKAESDFRNFAKTLTASADPAVGQLAREGLTGF